MPGSVELGRILGISVRLHFSWTFIFFLVAWSLAKGYFPNAFPGWSDATYWGIGILGSVLLFVSVLIHELSHSFMARARGHQVRSITLFILGGISEIEEESRKPSEEFWIAVVGPLTSLILSGIFWGVYIGLGTEGREEIRAITLYLGTVNLVLGVFNLIPAYPLDGGRVFRSVLWRSTGSLRRATTVVSSVGILIGIGFMALGFILAFTSDLIGGLWLAFIGWFLQSSAASARKQQILEASLTGKLVRDAMRETFPLVSPGTSVQNLIDDYIMKEFERAFVVQLGDTFLGLVTVSDVRKCPIEERPQTPVSQIMTPADEVIAVSPDTPLGEALKFIAYRGLQQLAVAEHERIVGLVTRGDVLRVLEMSELFPTTESRRT